MKIVIDIDDDMYKSVVNNDAYVLGDADWILLENAIYNGTPLPEHHGRLIDADELKKHKYHDSDRFENAVAVAQIDWAPTIIEADKCTYKETGCGSCKRQLDCPIEPEGSDSE